MSIAPRNKDTLSGSLVLRGNFSPANPIGYNGILIATSEYGNFSTKQGRPNLYTRFRIIAAETFNPFVSREVIA